MRNSRTIAINAILFALTIVLTVITSAVPIPGVSIAFLMLLPVLVAAQVERISTAAFTGFVLGLSSLVCAFIFPNVLSPLFYNPLVSVLPRILIGMVSWTAFRYTNIAIDKIADRLNKNKPPKSSIENLPYKRKGARRFAFVSAFSAMTGVITNTAFVLAMMWLFFRNKVVGEMVINAEFFTALLSLNFVIEIAVCAVLVPPIVYAVKLVLKQPLVVNGYDYLKKLNATVIADDAREHVGDSKTEDSICIGQSESINDLDATEIQGALVIDSSENATNNDENTLNIDTKTTGKPDSAVETVPDEKING